MDDIDTCQTELHAWGRANCVIFDAGKESKHVLSRRDPRGDPFDLLGIRFDCKLVVSDTVGSLAKDCKWKLRSILRTQRFNTGRQLVDLYKAQLLPFIEYRTPAIYHACASALCELDRTQEKLVAAAGLTELEALHESKLAPLASRRDMALLGLMHRTVLGRGPKHFRQFFRPDAQARDAGQRRHRLQLEEFAPHASDFDLLGSRPAAYLQFSMLGLVKVYTRLPARLVEANGCVSSFQAALQVVLAQRAAAGCCDWKSAFSPRVPMHRHPLLEVA